MSTSSEKRLIFIKTVHTLIWIMFVFIIAFILWSGITSSISIYSWLAVLSVVGEGLVLLIFNGSCPLTKAARNYSDSSKDNFDIYLPNWLARHNKQIFGALFFMGVALMLYRYLR